ncbi:hypothetical protein EDB89DRAFT_2048100 [Lactarius sanguifluus]|nr:hypothetical protein EDB89DRAFT_2048100 [Lactarius sanguifluus]
MGVELLQLLLYPDTNAADGTSCIVTEVASDESLGSDLRHHRRVSVERVNAKVNGKDGSDDTDFEVGQCGTWIFFEF